MKKILVDGDIAVIDGKEFTTEEIKKAIVEQYKFHKLTDFLQTQFPKAGVINE